MAAPKSDFAIVNQYLGWGEPRAGLWFVGLEEATEWSQEDVRRCMAEAGSTNGVYTPPSESIDFRGQQAGKTVRDYTCKIARAVSVHTVSWRDYRNTYLWTTRSATFQLNIFPLGKPTRREWPVAYEQLFGFGPKDRRAYEEYVSNTRFKAIARLRGHAQPQAVVCFGKEAWHHYAGIFGLCERPVDIEPGMIQSYPEQRVLLTPFFARYHMTNRRAELIAEQLQAWGVRIDSDSQLSGQLR